MARHLKLIELSCKMSSSCPPVESVIDPVSSVPPITHKSERQLPHANVRWWTELHRKVNAYANMHALGFFC